MRVPCLLTAVVLTAAGAAAQSHEPAEKAAPLTRRPVVSTAMAPKPDGEAHEADGARSGKPAPVVSRVSVTPKAAAERPSAGAPAATEHRPAGEAPPPAAATGHQAEAPASERPGGYVATGARQAEDEHGGDKPRPRVSGAPAAPKPAPVAGPHDAVPAAAASPTPHAATAAAAKPAAVDTPAAGTAAPSTRGPGTPARAATARQPAKLADVGQRIAAALAEARAESAAQKPEPVSGSEDATAAGHAPSGHAARPVKAAAGMPMPPSGGPGSPPRVMLQWPEPRWHLTWPEPGRVGLTWPDVAPEMTASPTRLPPQ